MSFFGQHHPLSLAIYYIVVIVFTISHLHPVSLFVTCLMVLFFLLAIQSKKYVLHECLFYTAIALWIVGYYILVAHNGVTPLFFLNDRAVTLEAIYRGSSLAICVVAIAFWYKAFAVFIKSNELFYLISRVSKSLALWVSIIWGMIPDAKLHFLHMQQTQKMIGNYQRQSRFERLQVYMQVFFSTCAYSVDTILNKTEVMKMRGYGRQKRTFFHPFNWYKRDVGLLIFTISCAIVMWYFQDWSYYFYPSLKPLNVKIIDIVTVWIFFFYPTFFEWKGHIRWYFIKSKI